MPAQPVLCDGGCAAFQDAGPAAGLGVDQDRRVDEALPQGEVVDAQDAGDAQVGKADRHQGTERRVPGDADAQRREQPGARAAC